ncbi:hypothetical protein CYMTET_49197 [Cymbomonas tetramitiformis]|uniref:Uncharacterized protein n=1 Tax=Cymbomonas tetramitiformis TaxID=36881 RepID=A0AAE0EUD7_9CHLO|nr:hypothetical protein CYMTET_49197 [Cymbomonas tetramitiformis]
MGCTTNQALVVIPNGLQASVLTQTENLYDIFQITQQGGGVVLCVGQNSQFSKEVLTNKVIDHLLDTITTIELLQSKSKFPENRKTILQHVEEVHGISKFDEVVQRALLESFRSLLLENMGGNIPPHVAKHFQVLDAREDE